MSSSKAGKQDPSGFAGSSTLFVVHLPYSPRLQDTGQGQGSMSSTTSLQTALLPAGERFNPEEFTEVICVLDAAFRPQSTETPMVMLHPAFTLTYPTDAAHGAPSWSCVGKQICQPPSCCLHCPSPDKTHQKLFLGKKQLLWILLTEVQVGLWQKARNACL